MCDSGERSIEFLFLNSPFCPLKTGDLLCLRVVLADLTPSPARLSSSAQQLHWLKSLASANAPVEAMLAELYRKLTSLGVNTRELLGVCRYGWGLLFRKNHISAWSRR